MPLRVSIAALLALTCALPAAAEGERTRVLVMDLALRGVDEAEGKIIGSLVSVELTKYDQLDVLSGEDVRRAMELEGEKAAAGCTDSSECLAEIAGALAAELVVFGEIGRLGDLMIVNLNLFDPAEVKSAGRVTVQTKSVDTMPAQLGPKLRELFAKRLGLVAKAPPPAPEPAPADLSWAPMATTVGGGVVAGVGLVLTVVGLGPMFAYNGAAAEFEAAPDDAAKRAALERANQAQQDQADWGAGTLTAGIVLTTVGLAALGGGLAWSFAGE